MCWYEYHDVLIAQWIFDELWKRGISKFICSSLEFQSFLFTLENCRIQDENKKIFQNGFIKSNWMVNLKDVNTMFQVDKIRFICIPSKKNNDIPIGDNGLKLDSKTKNYILKNLELLSDRWEFICKNFDKIFEKQLEDLKN